MITLRPYQEDSIKALFSYFESNKLGNPLEVLPCGSGKSVIISEFVRRVMQFPNQRILVACHVKELIEQSYEKLLLLWPDAPVGIFSASIGRKEPNQPIVYAGIQSIYKYAKKLGHRDLLLCDECQTLAPHQDGMYMQLIKELREINPDMRVIGYTATHWRSKGGSLIDQQNAIFTNIAYEKPLKELIEEGYLSPLISKSSIFQADLAKVKITGGEFNLKQAEAAIDKEELTNAALDEVERLAADRKHFLYFCAGIRHCEHVKEALAKRGLEAFVITCKTPKEERERILHYAKNSNEKTRLINNAVLTVGTDLPNLDCGVLLRVTNSSVLYYQILGRFMRLFPGKKNALILDYCGNIERFGPVDLLNPPKKRKPGEKAEAPVKICPECRSPVLIAARECQDCGYLFPEPERQKHDAKASMLSILSSQVPDEEYRVDDVYYHVHVKPGSPPSIKVTYRSGLKYFYEWICLFHVGYTAGKAWDWWMRREGKFCDDIKEALEEAPNLLVPKKIICKKNGKFYEIKKYIFEDDKEWKQQIQDANTHA